jgi:hypothetical protein
MANVTVDATNVRPLPGYIGFELDAAEAMSVGMIIQVDADSEALMANATAAATNKGTLGLVVAGGRHAASGAIVAGERITVVTYGRVYLGEAAALDESKTYYTSTTDGLISDTPTANARPIGTPVSATVLNFSVTSTEAGSP